MIDSAQCPHLVQLLQVAWHLPILVDVRIQTSYHNSSAFSFLLYEDLCEITVAIIVIIIIGTHG